MHYTQTRQAGQPQPSAWENAALLKRFVGTQPHSVIAFHDKIIGFMNGEQWMSFTLALARILASCLPQHPCL